ncbi:MAG: hypothetical protein ACKO0Z_05065, partial [Betaproteobacteria bacterium]
IEESRTNRLLWCRDASGPSKNLLTYSEQFDNAAWAKQNVTVSANSTTAPDGTNTADTLTDNNTNSWHEVDQTITLPIAAQVTISAYLKSGTNQYAFINISNSGSIYSVAIVDLINGTIVNTYSSGITINSTAITSATNGFYRASMTVTVTNQISFYARIGLSNSSAPSIPSWGLPSYIGTGSTIYLWGTQVEFSSAVTAYEQTTNLGAVWLKNSLVASKNQAGIDGVANAASSLTASADGGTCIQTVTLASGSRTGSVYLKRITGTGNVQVSLDGSTWSTVDLSNGLYNRIVLSGTVTNPVVGIRLATNGDAVAMDYGQVEDGAFVTTPILTTTATATRSDELPQLLGQNFITWYDRFNGTLYAQSVSRYTLGACTAFSIGVIGEGFHLRPQSTIVQGQINITSTDIALFLGPAVQSNQQANLSLSYRINDFAFSIDRATPPSNNPNNVSSRLPIVSQATIGSRNGSNFLNGTVSRVIYLPKKLSQSAIQDMTSGTT